MWRKVSISDFSPNVSQSDFWLLFAWRSCSLKLGQQFCQLLLFALFKEGHKHLRNGPTSQSKSWQKQMSNPTRVHSLGDSLPTAKCLTITQRNNIVPVYTSCFCCLKLNTFSWRLLAAKNLAFFFPASGLLNAWKGFFVNAGKIQLESFRRKLHGSLA